MSRFILSSRAGLRVVLGAGLLAACSSTGAPSPGNRASGSGVSEALADGGSSATASLGGGSSAATSGGGEAGFPGSASSSGWSSGGAPSGGTSSGVPGGPTTTPEAGGGGGSAGSSEISAGSSGTDAGSNAGSSGAGGSSDAGHGTGGGDASVVVPPGCTLPATVSFKTDVQPFLATSCGGTGCHVLDATSTMASGGYDHAYDWITGTAHASSCPETPTPLRFQVVLAVIGQANPSVCSKSRKMPPDATHPALTACQLATLETWLDEPFVTQTHRNDTISPTTPYPMPPFN